MSSSAERARIGCAILAAGSSQRLGRPKQLLHYHGTPLIRHIAQVVLAAHCDATAVITGCHAREVTLAVQGLDLETLDNALWMEGVAASIRVAAEWASRLEHDALLIVACDQVQLTTRHIEQLIDHYRSTTDSIASQYGGTVGIPALFGNAWLPRLLQLHGDRGAGTLLRAETPAHVVAWPGGELDIDTEHDIAQMRGVIV